jgi:hypothetical protein
MNPRTVAGWMILAILVPVITPQPSAAQPLEPNVDRPGMDYQNFDLTDARPELCRQKYVNDLNCNAYTYVKPGIQGPSARCWLKWGAPTQVQSQCCISGLARPTNTTVAVPPGSSSVELNVDRPGADYSNFDLTEANPFECRSRCENDVNCRAYTYVKPTIQATQARCWLKSAVPSPNPTACCISGVKPPLVLDLVADRGFDLNGIPLNPRWGYQTTPNQVLDPRQLCDPIFPLGRGRQVNPSCTSQSPPFEAPDSSSWNSIPCAFAPGLAPGHSNWFPVTYTGLISWAGKSSPVFDDDDYSMDLQTPDAGHSRAIAAMSISSLALTRLSTTSRRAGGRISTTPWTAPMPMLRFASTATRRS